MPPADTAATVTDPPAADGWAVDTDACADPDAAHASIDGTVDIGSVMPLTGGVAAAAYAPVKDGFEAYIAYARANDLFVGYDDIHLTVADDQFNADATSGAVAGQIAAGVDVFSGIIGTRNNREVRQTLNDACIPQLNALTGSPEWGDVATYPWTTGIVVPYNVESQIYATQLGELFPDGATVGLFSVASDFGQLYTQAFGAIAGQHGLVVVDQQTIDPADSNPPTLQMAHLADAAPAAIVAVPLGAGCISFLTELASARFQHPGWNPVVFLSNTCVDSPILRAAGGASDGLYTGANLVDIGNPAVQARPAIKDYVDFMTTRGTAAFLATAATGWTVGEITVAIVNQAASSPAGLTRASIIDAARNFRLHPSLARDGVVFTSQGEQDPYLAQSLQVVQYDADAGTFSDAGPLITAFES